MIEAGQRLGLALEAVDELRVLGQVLAQHLDGDVHLAPQVEGQVDVGHAAAPEQPLQAIAALDYGAVLHERLHGDGETEVRSQEETCTLTSGLALGWRRARWTRRKMSPVFGGRLGEGL